MVGQRLTNCKDDRSQAGIQRDQFGPSQVEQPRRLQIANGPPPELRRKRLGEMLKRLLAISRPLSVGLLVLEDEPPDLEVGQHLQPIDVRRCRAASGLDQRAHLTNERPERAPRGRLRVHLIDLEELGDEECPTHSPIASPSSAPSS